MSGSGADGSAGTGCTFTRSAHSMRLRKPSRAPAAGVDSADASTTSMRSKMTDGDESVGGPERAGVDGTCARSSRRRARSSSAHLRSYSATLMRDSCVLTVARSVGTDGGRVVGVEC